MMKKNWGRAAVAVLAGIVAGGTATAGPLNPLTNRSTTSTGAATVTETFTKSLGVSAISKTINTSSTSTSASTIVETFSASFVPSWAVSVTGNDLNYTSPHHNDGAVGGIVQTITVSANAGISQVQTTAGNANVTVASNGLYAGSAVAALSLTQTNCCSGPAIAAIVLAPGFALQNSNAVANFLAINSVAALSATSATKGYLELSQEGVSEYSPHHNEGVTGDIAQGVTVTATAGITQVQTQAGNANVQAAHNTIMYSSSIAGSVVK